MNARFAYSIAYPSDLLFPQGEADNGDGQKFLSKDGRAELIAYGSHNALQQSLAALFSEAIGNKGDSDMKQQITYKLLRKDWFVVSGLKAGRVFYQKTILRNKIIKTFRIEYEQELSGTFNGVTKELAKSFKG